MTNDASHNVKDMLSFKYTLTQKFLKYDFFVSISRTF